MDKALQRTVLACIALLSLALQVQAQDEFRLHRYHDDRTEMAAFQLLIPRGWQFSGGITWLPEPYKISENRFSITAPDGSAGFDYYPDSSFIWTQNQQQVRWFGQVMPVVMPRAALELLRESIIPRLRNTSDDLQILSAENRPQTAQALYMAMKEQLRADAVYAGLIGGTSYYFTAATAEVSYESNGVEYYKLITVTVLYFHDFSGTVIFWGPRRITSFWCRADQKEELQSRYVVMTSSLTPSPLFQHKLYQIQLQMLRDQLYPTDTGSLLSDYISKTRDEISQEVFSSIAGRDRAADRLFSCYSGKKLKLERYQDGDISLEVPAGYEDVWRNGDRVIVSDDPQYNPNRESSGSWNRMNRQR